MGQSSAARLEEMAQDTGMSEDALVAVSLSKVIAAQRNADDTNEDLKDTLSHVEDNGINVKAAKRAIKIVKGGKVDEWLKETADITKYLRILRSGVTKQQIDMFETESAIAPIDEKAGLDGRAAGLMGELESDSPHDSTTDAGQAWLREFRQGQSEREIIMNMQSEPAQTLIPANREDAAPTQSHDAFSDVLPGEGEDDTES